MQSTLDSIWQDIEAAAATHQIGGAVVLIQHRGEIVLRGHTGWAVREPETDRTPMADDTIFDLASLTKVVATAPAVLQLIGEDKIRLDDPLATYIPEFGDEDAKGDVTIRNLLSHSSGLTSWRGVYTTGNGIEAYIASLAADQPEAAPNSRVAYSCMGYILLGEVVRRVSGQRIDAYAEQHIFQPLAMTETGYLPDPALRHRIAATEHGNHYEVATAGADPVQGWRQYLLRGEVHDGNAWYGMGGVSGNAGLFGTADDVLRYARMWLNGGELAGVRILPPDLVHEATREQTGLAAPNQRRGLGWLMAPLPFPPELLAEASGAGLSEHAFGHTGFTGTSMWIDPERELISILLTNRVHPTVGQDWAFTRATISQQLAEIFPITRHIAPQLAPRGAFS